MQILWNYLAIRSELQPTLPWTAEVSEEYHEKRCVVGAKVAVWSIMIATVHLSHVYDEERLQGPKLVESLEIHGADAPNGTIVLGDFNTDQHLYNWPAGYKT